MSDNTRRAEKAKHTEIERRYRRRAKPKAPRSIAALRMRDLNKLYTARHGHTLPADANGRALALIAAHHLAAFAGDPRKRIANWIELRCPWLTVAEAKALTAEAITNPRRWRADKLAWRLRLIELDRRILGITTIGAIDLGKAQRAERRKQRHRALAELRRRAQGAKPRAEYLANAASQARPWTALGISRRTWERRCRKSVTTI